jgi:hypothetical protein
MVLLWSLDHDDDLFIALVVDDGTNCCHVSKDLNCSNLSLPPQVVSLMGKILCDRLGQRTSTAGEEV